MREHGKTSRRDRDRDVEPSILDSAPASMPQIDRPAPGRESVDPDSEPSPEEQRVRIEHRLDGIRIGTAPPAPQAALPVQRQPATVAVQRDGPLTLQTPSLLQPADPAARYHLGGDQHLHLDPAIEEMARQFVLQRLNPAALRPALSQVRFGGPRVAGAGGSAPGLPGSTGVPAAALSGPPTPAAAPLVPAGAGPDSAHPADVSDILGAVMAIPAIDQGITNLQTQATDRVSRDWRRLATGEKIGVVSTIAVIGLGTLGGVASDPKARQLALSQLNGRVLPVPGVDWLHLEVNTGGDSLMVGMHVDMGQLLPKSWGFGPGSPSAIGGPPQPEPFVPGQRRVDPSPQDREEKRPPAPSVGQQITAAAGGTPLDDSVRPRLEAGLGASLADVRVHTGGSADSLARSVDAVAFTSGQDIFFRSGAFAPGTTDGYRLLAHEATHTVQQAAGPVSGTPAPGGVSLSDPSDPFERAADRAAEAAVTRAAESRAAPAPVAGPSAALSIDEGGPREPASPRSAAHSFATIPAYPSTAPVQRSNELPAGNSTPSEADPRPLAVAVQREPNGWSGPSYARHGPEGSVPEQRRAALKSPAAFTAEYDNACLDAVKKIGESIETLYHVGEELDKRAESGSMWKANDKDLTALAKQVRDLAKALKGFKDGVDTLRKKGFDFSKTNFDQEPQLPGMPPTAWRCTTG